MNEAELEEHGLKTLENVDAYASLENSSDGSTSYCEITPNNIEVTDISDETVTYEASYSVDVYEEVPENDSAMDDVGYSMDSTDDIAIVPCYTKSNSKADSSGSYRATTTLTYNVTYSGSTTYVQLTKVSGGWEKLANGVSGSNRRVTYGSYNQKGSKYPTSNSFSYNTGFSKDKWSSNMAYGCTTLIDLSRGTSSDTWTLSMTCNLGESDIDL